MASIVLYNSVADFHGRPAAPPASIVTANHRSKPQLTWCSDVCTSTKLKCAQSKAKRPVNGCHGLPSFASRGGIDVGFAKGRRSWPSLSHGTPLKYVLDYQLWPTQNHAYDLSLICGWTKVVNCDSLF